MERVKGIEPKCLLIASGQRPTRDQIISEGSIKRRLERVKGIEPSYAAWEAAVLPLNYTRDGGDHSRKRPCGASALT